MILNAVEFQQPDALCSALGERSQLVNTLPVVYFKKPLRDAFVRKIQLKYAAHVVQYTTCQLM